MKSELTDFGRTLVLPLLTLMAVSIFTTEANAQLFRRYSQPAYSPYGGYSAYQPYQPNYAAQTSSCTCQQQQAQQQQGYRYSNAQPQAVRYAVYYNPRTGQTYLRPINGTASSQTSRTSQPNQVDVARTAPQTPVDAAVTKPATTQPTLTSPVIEPITNATQVIQPALVEPALVAPADASVVDSSVAPASSTPAAPVDNAVSEATFTSQPSVIEKKPSKQVDVETNNEAPTPAPAKVETEKESFSILEPTDGKK